MLNPNADETVVFMWVEGVNQELEAAWEAGDTPRMQALARLLIVLLRRDFQLLERRVLSAVGVGIN